MKYTTKQLLDIVRSQKEVITEEASFLSSVERFINAVKIKAGPFRVPSRIVWKSYKIWSGEKLTVKSFLLKFTTYFPRDPGAKHYLLNYTPIELLNKVDKMRVKFK